MKNSVWRMVAAGVFLAMGLVLPWATSHAFGLPGTILLPMHIPVLICGLICGPRYGAACGVLIPLLSCLLTGMPAAYPMLPVMAAQLLAMGTIGALLYQTCRLSIYPSLLLTMVSGWAVYGSALALLMFMNGSLMVPSVAVAIVRGIPGIAIQLVLIPLLVQALKAYRNTPARTEPEADEALSGALRLIKGGDVSCVVMQEGKIVHAADGRGVSPLLGLYNSEPQKLKNAFVVDKIIGKAAAMILVLGGATRVYGVVMSAAGRQYLQQHGIAAEYGRCVEVIAGRDRTGICPIEKSVLDIDDPAAGIATITETLKALTKQAG